MRVSVIGAGGFLGRRVAAKLSESDRVSSLCLMDLAPLPDLPGAELIQGDFAAPALRARLKDGADVVIHLASILGGAAETDPALARRVNIDATIDLIEDLKGSATRFVFASTVAALGEGLPDPVTDATPLAPSLLYGAHKVMIETLLSTYARRGWLDGVSLRPAGIVARAGLDPALKSAFLSDLFHAVREGRDITLPVAEDSQSWMASVEAVAQGFVHAALLPELGPARAITLPALPVRFGPLVEALRRACPESPSAVRFDPDPATIALFGRHPRLVTEAADALGFPRDEGLDALVAAAV